MKNYEPEANFNDENEDVECYYYCNGFCMISSCYRQCPLCPFEGGEKLDCEDYKEA